MGLKIYILITFLPCLLMAQVPCTMTGQTPSNAFIICGNNTYAQSPLMNCYNKGFYVHGCTNENTSYGDYNPVYYKFTCSSSGTLGFTVIPWRSNYDYNWQLFDITGKNPNDIYTDKTTSVIGNWSGTPGSTGASAAGVNFSQCRSSSLDNKNTFSAMPQLIAGHTYLLMISGLDESGSYTLTIGGGTADITDKTTPVINPSVSSCSNNETVLSFSKRISCASIAADGSDFSIVPAAATITSVTGINCNSNSETDSIRIRFSNPLPNGSYTLSIKNGTDNNTLSDACRNFMAPGTQLKLNISPFASIDTVITTCKPQLLTVYLSKNVLCNSIARDGSDFVITGPSPVTITAASFNCSDAITNTVILQLQQPITTAGNYNLVIKRGNDGNTFLSTCNDITPSGTSYSLQIKETVNAAFTYSISEGCVADTVSFNNAGGNGVNFWNWNFKNSGSNLQRPTVVYTSDGNQMATLIVSNGVCSDSSQQSFLLKPKLKADFSIPDTGCADEPIAIINKTRNATGWLWDFSNGMTSTFEEPEPVLYPSASSDKKYTVTLTANNVNCSFTQTKTIFIKSNCIIAVPSAFTPNDDGVNDVFGPVNVFAVKNVVFKVFNRFGQTVFTYSVSSNAWNGKLNGLQQPSGIYVWYLSYTNPTTGIPVSRKGNVVLVR